MADGRFDDPDEDGPVPTGRPVASTPAPDPLPSLGGPALDNEAQRLELLGAIGFGTGSATGITFGSGDGDGHGNDGEKCHDANYAGHYDDDDDGDDDDDLGADDLAVLEEVGWSAGGDFTKRLSAQPNSQAQQQNKGPQRKTATNGGSSGRRAMRGAVNLGKIHAALREHDMKEDKGRVRHRDKSDRATTEQVLDPRTRLILHKLVAAGRVQRILGCISTGKEANVYAAFGPEGEDYAVKVYKTSILAFKDRSRYIEGDHRFKNAYSKSNSRSMVATWAEKEFRNLNRINNIGVPSPKPILVKSNVMVMELIGKDGYAAPRLKDALVSAERARVCYVQVVKEMRRMYIDCRLVHSDLSPYNILYLSGKCYIIDVGQAVDIDHPHAAEFLRKDCVNINAHFARLGLDPMSGRELFGFVTGRGFSQASDGDGVDAELDRIMELVELRRHGRDAGKEDEDDSLQIAPETLKEMQKREVEESIFMGSFVPNRLDEVVNPERDAESIARGDAAGLIYAGALALSPDNDAKDKGSGNSNNSKGNNDSVKTAKKTAGAGKVTFTSQAATTVPKTSNRDANQVQEQEDDDEDDDDDDDDEDDDDDDDDDDGYSSSGDGDGKRRSRKRVDGGTGELTGDPDGPAFDEQGNQLRPLTKKERKKYVKEQNRERRKTKMPKHIKKRKQKIAGRPGVK